MNQDQYYAQALTGAEALGRVMWVESLIKLMEKDA